MVDHQCVRKCTESVGGWTTGPTCFWNIQSVLSCWKQVLQPASLEAKVKTQSQIETAEDGGDGFGKARPLAPTYGHLVLCESEEMSQQTSALKKETSTMKVGERMHDSQG